MNSFRPRISHYYVVSGRKIKVDDLYTMDGCYRYTYGVNFRAYGAYFSGILMFRLWRQPFQSKY